MWFFGFLVVAGILVIIGSFVAKKYFLQRALTHQRLDEARALWNKKRPRNYDLTYSMKGSTAGKFFVKVRDGKVKDVTLDGHALTQDDRPLDPRFYPRYDMSGRFDDINDFLKRDAEPGQPRAIAVARFDPEDGHLLQYTRKVADNNEFIELTDFVLTPLPDEPAGKKTRNQGTPKP
jgi:hypothetical protein